MEKMLNREVIIILWTNLDIGDHGNNGFDFREMCVGTW